MARSWYGFWASICLCAGLSITTSTGVAQAQGKDDSFSLDDPDQAKEPSKVPAPEEVPMPPAEDTGLLTDEQAMQEERAPQEKFRESTDPYEDPKKGYFFAGVNWRYLFLPKGVLEMFLDAAPSVGSGGSFFGEFGYRKDGFQVGANVGWMKFNFNGPFRLAGDPDTDTEWLDTNWNLLVLSSTITWSTSFTDWVALEYGLEAGVAFIFGDMRRSEAYPGANGDYNRCPGPVSTINTPTPEQQAFCAEPINGQQFTNAASEDGEHYGVKAERGIANSGVPYAVPVIGPRLSVRFKPIHQVVLRVDLPLPVFPMGFVGGLAAQYGF